MRNLTTLFIVALFTFIFGVAATAAYFVNRQSEKSNRQSGAAAVQESQEPKLEIPKARWEPALFKIINERTDEARLPRLRSVRLLDDDLEVRVWVGFGQNGEDGLILRRISNQWSATHLHGMFKVYPPDIYREELPEPKSGWDATWQELVHAELLTLPDATSVQCNSYVKDGITYVVEVNTNKTYRTYMYDNPNLAGCDKAKQAVSLGEIIADEFHLKEFRISQ